MRTKMAVSLVLVMLFTLFPQLMVFSLGSETALAAGTSPATLEDISGGVFVKKGGGVKEFQAINGMALSQGDSIRSAKEGSATVVFYTGSKMAVGPSTSFTLNKLKATKDSGGKISVKLRSGTVWNKVKSLVNMEDEYEIETPTTVMGVRGTMLLVGVDPNTGEVTMSVMDGSVAAHYNHMRNSGAQEQLVLMGNSIHMPPELFQHSMHIQPPPPPPPSHINMSSIVDRQDPFILANMALDVVDRMQELEQQSQGYLAGYQNSNNQAYLQGALQISQTNTLLADLSQQYMSAVQGTVREQQMNQLLQQQNRSMDALRQQAQRLHEQAQQMRNNTENAAEQAGFSSDQIQRLMQNAVTAAAAAGISRTAPPPVTPPAQPTQPSGGGSSDDNNNEPTTQEMTQLTGISDITGTARVGETLIAGTVSPGAATVTYQWQIAENAAGTYVNIDGANESQYTLSANDVNKYIRLAATGTGDYTGIVYSQPTLPIAEAIPAEWSSPEPSVSVDTLGDEPLIIVEYKANQSGEVYYMITEEGLQLEEDPSFLEMVMDEAERDQIIFKGSEKCSSEELERLEMPYPEGIYADKDYNLYMVLKGVNDNSAIKKITFHTPEDNNPPVLTAEVDYNNDTGEMVINHSVQDYDELYDLYVQIIPKDMDTQPTPDELAVKEYGINNEMAYLEQRSGAENDDIRIPLATSQPGEYLVYLVAQDRSSADETGDGLYSEVLQFLVTKPSPSTN